MHDQEFDDEVRAAIAKSLWEYNECDEYLGELSGKPASPIGGMVRSMTIDQAECIRVVLSDRGYLSKPKRPEGIVLAVVVPVLGGLMMGSGIGYIAAVIRMAWILHG